MRNQPCIFREPRPSRPGPTAARERTLTTPPPDDFLWFCQLAADGEYIGAPAQRKPTLPYLASLVETAAEMGFSSLLTATNFHAEHDAWTASVATLAQTRGAGLLIAVRPGMFHPAIFAKMTATAAALFPGRVRINVVTGSNPAELAMYGDADTHDERYQRTHEFIHILRRLWTEPVVDHQGRFYRMRGAVLEPKPAPAVPIYLGGHSAPAQRLAAELADVYLVWADTVPGIAARLASMREAEQAAGRRVRYGLRSHVIVRETEREAWAAAERLISRIDPATREAFLKAAAVTDSEGQRRQNQLSSQGSLVVEENLWAGVGLARTGVGLAIVGDPDQVVAKIRAYQALGISTFILSGYPHLEECRRVGEMVLPRLRAARIEATLDGPAGAQAARAKAAAGIAPVT